jgi:hypothetical protein
MFNRASSGIGESFIIQILSKEPDITSDFYVFLLIFSIPIISQYIQETIE